MSQMAEKPLTKRGESWQSDGTSLKAFLADPLQGKTSLTKVFWLYGVLGSVLLSASGLALDPSQPVSSCGRIYVSSACCSSVYVTVATYRCAGNCRSKILAGFVRFSAVVSLLLLPVFGLSGLHGSHRPILEHHGRRTIR
jgi:hypothetical protein